MCITRGDHFSDQVLCLYAQVLACHCRPGKARSRGGRTATKISFGRILMTSVQSATTSKTCGNLRRKYLAVKGVLLGHWPTQGIATSIRGVAGPLLVALQRWTETVVDHRLRLSVELKSAASHFWIASHTVGHRWRKPPCGGRAHPSTAHPTLPWATWQPLTAELAWKRLTDAFRAFLTVQRYYHNGWAAAASPAAGLVGCQVTCTGYNLLHRRTPFESCRSCVIHAFNSH